jgi:hypothetical protein
LLSVLAYLVHLDPWMALRGWARKFAARML